jgi:2-oxo-4-hydroxy-4-carboxy-5-ureidoimidazoline decarboxylase
MISLVDLNQMQQEEFVAVLGEVFEQTPAIARQVWTQRPFASVTALHQGMVAIVHSMSPAEQLALIRAHPDLGSKAKMAAASVQEQTGVGLDRLTPEEYDRFHRLNHAYREQFGFPFIIAVRNHTKSSILEAFEQRLQNPLDAERERAIAEITQIARFRLMDWVTE